MTIARSTPTTSPTPRVAFAALVAALSLSGCALHPVPSLQLEGARAAIATATLAGAETQAPENLVLAREKLALTRRWLAAGDNEPVRWLAEQAQVDAELATMKAASLQAQHAVHTRNATGAPS